MNYLFLVNAGILALIGYFVFSRKRDRLSLILLISNAGLVVWNICIFLTEEYAIQVNIDLVSKIKLLSLLLHASSLFYFCRSYPYPRSSRISYLNIPLFMIMAVLMLGTDLITRAEIVGGMVVFIDNPVGFPLFTFYLASLGVSALGYLIVGYRRYPEHRSNIRFLFTGLGLFALFGIGCNLVLPMFQYYDLLILGRLSALFPALFFAYVITKNDFMNLEVIVNKPASWVVTGAIVVSSFGLIYSLVNDSELLLFILLSFAGLFWAVSAGPLQNFLLTSAKRKFVRGWYDTEDVITALSRKITAEKNRESIFNTLEAMLDEVFQLEQSKVIMALRDYNENFSHYLSVSKQGKNTEKRELAADSPLLEAFHGSTQPVFVDDCNSEVKKLLKAEGYPPGKRTVLIPFHSPEQLEGIIVLGERSNQEAYSQRDIRFFSRLTNYMSALLYRLTPMEKLEQLYRENRQKLHNAEIQLLRAQKIEAIVHATRQCHHEIRTPLNIIRLGIGRIKTQEDLESYKQVAMEEISRALEIVEETLTITDVNEPAVERYTTVDVNEVLGRCSRLVDGGRYSLEVDLQAVEPVRGIFSDIQVAVTNLIHNALDAMPEGGMLAMRSRDDNGSVIIEIEDSGGGIPDELRARVWEPYFSGQQTEVGNSTAGRGWGLTIVNRIVTEHDGTVNFSSELGRGTKFTISLPAIRESEAESVTVRESRVAGNSLGGDEPRH